MGKEIQKTINQDDDSSAYRDIISQQYRINKKLLCAVGLWPYQSRKGKAVQIGGLLFLSFFIMVVQVRTMVLAWGRFGVIVECLTPLLTNIIGILKISSGLINTQEMRKIFDQIQKDWDDMRHLPQLSIIERCAETGRHWTIFYCTLVYTITFGWYVMAFAPKIMDAIAPLNYSRRRFDLFPIDFGVDPEEYFFTILIFLCLCIAYQLAVSIAMDTLYMVIAQHVCAMFEILRHNLHNILQDHESTNVILNGNIYDDKHYHEIISCIKKHKVIIEYIKNIEFTCEWKLLVIIGLSMLGLSFTGYMVVTSSSSADTIKFACFSIGQVFHLFCNTLPSHWIMESSSFLPNSAYSCRWYMMSLRSRKLIRFLIRASIEPCKITAGKVYVVSMENFSGVLKTSMSYLTMLNSMQ